MRHFIASFVTMTLLVAAPLVAADKPAKNDKARLQGNWSLVSVEIEAKPVSMDELKEARLVVSGDHYSFTLGKDRLEITFKMDEGKKPKSIDLTVIEGPEKGKAYYGIYKLEGDTYTICRSTEPNKERPTEFATQPVSGHMIVVWKRVKP
jgi:uncharacterized protein (TIGR03067 family)